MRNWVIPYLLEEIEKPNEEAGIDREQAEFIMSQMKEELENDEAVFDRLADELRIHFSTFGLGGIGRVFKTVFGSVLSDPPKEVFLQFVGMKHVFYVFTPNPGAEVKPKQDFIGIE